MKLDKIDLKLLNELYILKEKETTTSLAKKIFEVSKRSEIQKMDSKVRDRLKKLIGYGLVINEKIDGKTYYSLNMDAVVCARGSIKTKPKVDYLPEKEMEAENIVMITKKDGLYIHTHIPVED